ncbi:MAG TPA: leucyl aminopeptidase family protein, partial [Gammaproteobacteria bacterium]|nr:leucyl aminopeptidase family protein [Gammaproteobacteria bacterium]
EFSDWLAKQDDATKNWLADSNFKGDAGTVNVVPGNNGQINLVICVVTDKKNLWSVGGLAMSLPAGVYEFVNAGDAYQDDAIAWGLGAYQFTRYKKPVREVAKLVLPDEISAQVDNIVRSIYLVRDLINTPTEDMGPTELAQAAEKLAHEYDAEFRQSIGDELLSDNYPAIHAVGRASDDAPRLLDLTWGNPSHPKVTLVGKGVCFDTGGLDIKPSAYMLLMKKDMGGAAHVLGLARMIMQAKLPVRLRVLIPAVENAVSGNSYRPGDVIKSRKGLTIEIGNTDAEGRVVLADALTEAVSEKPEVLIDIATLTGAARVAVGTDIAAVFSNNDLFVNDVITHAEKKNDPMWRLPLYAAYRENLNSAIADINNNSVDSYAGAITAALFLKEFVPDDISWLHFDIMAWNLRAKPGKPVGGEAMALRALFAYLEERYSA